LRTCLYNHKKIFLCIIIFFIFSISVNAKIIIESEETTFPGGLIRVYVVANEKIKNFYVLFNTEDGKNIARFEGFRYFFGQIADLLNKPPNVECMVAIISTGSTIKNGKYKVAVYINNEETPRKEFPVSIEKKEFKTETISLNRSLSNLRTDTSERREKESQEFNRLLSTFNKENVFTESVLIKPLTAEPYYITSRYGDIRKFVYQDGRTANSIHHGIDYAAAHGSPIFASAAGKVVFAGDRLITGSTIAIEHLPGLYSLYYHLDKLYVTENMIVSKGVTIGTLGSTGLATGPHLHWEIRNQRRPVDPDFRMENAMIDKDKIMSIIKNNFADIAEGR
jgi:murein DD-endopeptidase MepM/ murein hydrolase activator NlpD